MQITSENAKEFAHNVMTTKDVRGYNEIHGTSYKTKEELLAQETDAAVAEFFNP